MPPVRRQEGGRCRAWVLGVLLLAGKNSRWPQSRLAWLSATTSSLDYGRQGCALPEPPRPVVAAVGPGDALEVPPRQPRRHALAGALAGAAGAGLALPALAEEGEGGAGAVFRVQKSVPRVPRTLAVLLLRSTYEAVEGWGAYNSMTEYQIAFSTMRSKAMSNFRDRYANYDLTDLFDPEKVKATGGGVTNKLYFAFLNEVQWRTIAKKIVNQRDRFGRLIGDRLYKKILKGFELRADVEAPQEEPVVIGAVPKISQPLPAGKGAADIRTGTAQLLDYLRELGYCEGSDISEVTQEADGSLRFKAFVKEAVNLDATASLMRSNDNFVPRYDQRILQAYFADRGYDSEFSDRLANSMDEPEEKKPSGLGRKIGVVSSWKLRPDPDAGV
eukprot:TRINITY_DN11301_c0_g1_i1.p1 TRINITY_DN11301_c0_g1~~TRINITY_DN11301_c0_g1_i1.p1  ORF type:complete len:387 (-),score=98.91 TRINITY_DN11301_c0_g1_i1:245-1405(-)